MNELAGIAVAEYALHVIMLSQFWSFVQDLPFFEWFYDVNVQCSEWITLA
jgi:hypothetical protein